MPRSRKFIGVVLLFSFLLGGAAASGAQRKSLAIFSFRPTNFEAMGYSADIISALSSLLGRNKTVDLMSRREMEETLSRAALQQSDNADAVQQAGRVLGVDFVVFGQVTKEGSEIQFAINLMDIRDNRVLQTWSISFTSRQNIVAGLPFFVDKLTDTVENRDRYSNRSAETPPTVTIKNFQADLKRDGVVLKWEFDPSLPIESFNVYRSNTVGGPYTFVGKTATPIYRDKKIKRRQVYYYRIGIVDRSGKEVKEKKAVSIETAGVKRPHPPILMKSTVSIRRIEIEFVPSLQNQQSNIKIDEYKIYRKTASDNDWQQIATIDAKKTSRIVPNITYRDNDRLEDNETYRYAVTSWNKKNGESSLSDSLSVTTMGLPVLSIVRPRSLRTVDLTWKPVGNAEGYNLYRRSEQEDWKKVAQIRGGGKSRHTDKKGLKDGRYYTYYLTIYDVNGESGPSKEVKAKTRDLPVHPRNLIVRSGLARSVEISWEPLDDPDVGGYAIYRGTGKTKLQRIAKIKGHGSRSFMDRGTSSRPLKDGMDYYYSVAGFNIFQVKGESSPVALARTKPRPARVKGLSVLTADGRIVVQWKKGPEPDIERYRLHRSRNEGSWSTIVEMDPDQTLYKDSDLKPEVMYRYRVIVEDATGLKSDPADSNSVPSPLTRENSK